MSLNKAIETQFCKKLDDEDCTEEQITKFASRWSMRRRRKREYKLTLD
jgi:hypothetical protein